MWFIAVVVMYACRLYVVPGKVIKIQGPQKVTTYRNSYNFNGWSVPGFRSYFQYRTRKTAQQNFLQSNSIHYMCHQNDFKRSHFWLYFWKLLECIMTQPQLQHFLAWNEKSRCGKFVKLIREGKAGAFKIEDRSSSL